MESLKRRFVYTESPPIVDIYYGTGTTAQLIDGSFGVVDANFITTTFARASGYIGSPTGRHYTFGLGFGYYYWAIPDEPSGSTSGYRVVRYAKWTDGNDLGMIPSCVCVPEFYYKLQEDPTVGPQLIYYGYVNIYGVRYRLYRTSESYIDGQEFVLYSW
jgi:hypothetical protein